MDRLPQVGDIVDFPINRNEKTQRYTKNQKKFTRCLILDMPDHTFRNEFLVVWVLSQPSYKTHFWTFREADLPDIVLVAESE